MVRTQVRVPGTRQKYQHPRNNNILDENDDFNTYVVVGSLRAATNFERLEVRRHVMTLEASRVVSRIYHNNENTAVLSLLFPYIRESHDQLLSRIE